MVLIVAGISIVIFIIIAVLAGAGYRTFSRAQELARMNVSIQNMKANIYFSMIQYAQDNADCYPDRIMMDGQTRDAQNANEAFRALFINDILTDEDAFRVSPSPAAPDGNVGQAPDYRQALEAGECHYAMVKGASSTDKGSFPIVWENSKSGGWDPMWDATVENTERGRTWSGGRVLLLMQGGSVRQVKLDEMDAPSKLEKNHERGTNPFTRGEDSAARQALDPVF